MKYIFIIFILNISYSQCDAISESQCVSNSNCEWIEYLESGWCGSFNNNSSECNSVDSCSYTTCQQECDWGGSAECESHPGCSYSYLTYSCSGTTTVPCCSGGSYQTDSSYCQEIEVLECAEMNQLQCMQDAGCNWGQNEIESGNCDALNSYTDCNSISDCSWTSYQQECNWGGSQECESYPGCSYSYLTYSCSGTTTISYCSGGNYETPVYSCEEVEELECTEMYQSQCDQNSGCEWVEDIAWGYCGNLNPTWNNGGQFCNDPSVSTDQCYTYTCYGGYYGEWNTCCGGDPYIIDNNSYCEEVSFIPGDATGDGYLDVMDVVIIVDFILNDEYDIYADVNQDGILNVMDVVELVSAILGD